MSSLSPKPQPHETGDRSLQPVLHTTSATSHPASAAPHSGGAIQGTTTTAMVEAPPIASYPVMAVDTDPMTVLRINFNSLSHMVENVFGERNHQITCLKTQNESLRLKISNDAYEMDRITTESAHIKTEIERLTLENERLKDDNNRLNSFVSQQQQTHGRRNSKSPDGKSPRNLSRQEHPDDGHRHGQQHPQEAQNEHPPSREMEQIRRLQQMLEDSSNRCATLEKRCKDITNARSVSMQRVKELERAEVSTMGDLRDLAGGSDAASKTLSVKRIIELIRIRIGVLQKRVEDEAKKACLDAQRTRELTRKAEKVEQQLKVEKERIAAMSNLKSQNDKLKKDINKQNKEMEATKQQNVEMEAKLHIYESQIEHVRQIALLAGVNGIENKNNNKTGSKNNSNKADKNNSNTTKSPKAMKTSNKAKKTATPSGPKATSKSSKSEQKTPTKGIVQCDSPQPSTKSSKNKKRTRDESTDQSGDSAGKKKKKKSSKQKIQ